MTTRALNQRTAAVVDPILSTHARGYRNSTFIAGALFPRVSIPNRSMLVIKFGKEAFRKLNTRRAPGSATKRVQYGYASDPVALVQDSLEGIVPTEHQQEAEKVPGIDLGAGAVNMVLDVLDLNLEVESARLARDPANYDANHKLALTGTDRWTDPDSDPKADFDEAREIIRRSIGRYPNTLALGPNSGNALKNHPKIKEQFKYTGRDSITAEMIAAYFDIKKVVIGAAVYLPETADDATLANDVWGDDAILAYVPETGDNFQVPSFAYTYELTGYPQVEQPYYERPIKSWVYPTTAERRPYLVGAEGGFLFQGAGSK
ncbi:major capsid protein [Allorhizobium sp. BGMRC 0089]|uniref:major capsid protein n=1 Tax=Allorhizobium sonneratiae TaxID=2934936 RepID=UPI0020334E63|nr:major capsid protein [Allorhizobium sonneratiae]MCM2291087.1 major capsid protein [Allorhizobium sonneratiae]